MAPGENWAPRGEEWPNMYTAVGFWNVDTVGKGLIEWAPGYRLIINR